MLPDSIGTGQDATVDLSRRYDLLVVGGGNAALCAAITARSLGLDVLIVESAPIHFRGGNSRHTRNMRTMHQGPLEHSPMPIPRRNGLRETRAMGVLVALHLGAVMALFLTLPYRKFVHALYRFAALVRFHIERKRPPPDTVGD